jgi:hypothetical protein
VEEQGFDVATPEAMDKTIEQEVQLWLPMLESLNLPKTDE